MQAELLSYIKFWFPTEKERCISWTKIDSKNSMNSIVCNIRIRNPLTETLNQPQCDKTNSKQTRIQNSIMYISAIRILAQTLKYSAKCLFFISYEREE